MSNDPKSKWSRRAAELPKAHPSTKEISIGQRLTRLRSPGQAKTAVDGIPRTPWGTTDRTTKKPEPIPVVPTVRPTRIGNTILDPATIAAKENFEASKQGLAHQKFRASRLQQMLETLSLEDANAILVGFKSKHPEWWSSPFNCSQLVQVFLNCYDNFAEGVNGFNISSLDVVYAWMVQQRPPFFEPQNRRRGEPSVRPYVYQPDVQEETLAQKRIEYTVVTPERRAELKEMPFEELARQARAGYKQPKRTSDDFRG